MANTGQSFNFLLAGVKGAESGTMEFFVTGTSTPKNVYTSADLSTGATTSISLDLNGAVAGSTVYFGAGLYRVIIKDVDGTTLYTKDAVAFGSSLTFNMSSYDDLDDAVTSIGATEGDLVIHSQFKVEDGDGDDAAVVVPATLRLVFLRGGSLAFNGTEQVTISSIEAGPWTIFDSVGSGDVIWGSVSGVPVIYPQWFGALGDNSNNDQPSMQFAADSLISGQTLFFPPGNYVSSTGSGTVQIYVDGVTIEGAPGARIRPSQTRACFTIGKGEVTEAEVPQLVTNSITNNTFNSNTTGWTATGADITAALPSDDGKTDFDGKALRVAQTAGSSSSQEVANSITTVVGKSYIVTGYVLAGDATDGSFWIDATDATGQIASVNGVASTTWTEYHFTFQARTTSTTINVVKASDEANKFMFFDDVDCYEMTSNVTVRGLELSEVNATLDGGSRGIEMLYANNVLIDNVHGKGNFQWLFSTGNDSLDDCYDIKFNNVSLTQGVLHTTVGYFMGFFRTYSSYVVSATCETMGAPELLVLHDCWDIHINGITLKDTATTDGANDGKTAQAIDFTRCRGCTVDGFTIDGCTSGIVSNFAATDEGSGLALDNTFSNGTIMNALNALVVSNTKNKFIYITTRNSGTADVAIQSTTSDNIFAFCNFEGGLVSEASAGGIFVQSWILNQGIKENEIHIWDVTQSGRDYSTITKVTVLSTAEIIALETTPIELVPAQGANTWIEFLGAMIAYNYDTAAFTDTGADNDIVIRYEGGAGTDLTAAIQATGFIDQANDEIRFAPASSWTVSDDIVAVVNKNIEIHNPGTGIDDGGASTLIVSVNYRVHKTGL